jgi:hypothetical protein
MTPWEKAEDWLRPSRFAMILAAFVILQFPNILLGAETFFFRDFGFFGYPLAAYHRDSFWQGELPFWNPYNNAGLPFLAQWNTMVLYPGSFIYLFLPMPWGLNLFCLAHQFLAGLGMYFLGRSSAKSNLAGAIAAMAFAFSGLILSSLKWPNNIAAFALMPWVVWKCLQALENPKPARVILAGILGAVQMLSGAPEVILLTWTVIGVLGLAESIRQKRALPFLSLVAIIALVSALAAPQLFPFLDLLKSSQRSTTFAGSDWPMPIWGWLNFLQPLYRTFASYHGVPAQPNQYWISTYYVPLAAVAFAILALRRPGRPRLLAALALIGVLLALGEPGKVYALVRDIFPPIGFMRFPIKFVVLPVFLLAWLSAYGVQALREMEPQKYQKAAGWLVLPWSLIYLLAPNPGEFRSFGMLPFIFLGAFVVILTLFGKSLRPVQTLSLLLSVIWADAKFHSPQQNPSAPKWVFDQNILEFAEPPRAGQGRAMLGAEAALKMDHLMFDTPEKDIVATRLSLFCNANLIDRIPKIDGFFSLYLREPQQLIDLIYANTNRSFPGLEKLLQVSHRTAPGKTTEWTTNNVSDYPWISAGQSIVYTNTPQIIREITADNFDPASTLYLPIEASVSPVTNRVFIESASWTPNRISFIATGNSQPAWVFISQSFHHGWRAMTPESRPMIERANHGFMAVLVRQGGGPIELRYVAPGYLAGMALAMAGLAAIGILLRKRA